LEHVDVAIVGGRVAGAAMAINLARGGLSVVLFERAEMPSDTLSTHTVQELPGFGRLGLLDAMLDTGAPPLIRSTMWVDDLDLSVEHPGQPWLSIRRLTLDPLVLAAAEQAGADIRTRCKVTGLDRSWDRVSGVRYRRPDGSAGALSCRLVIGADGRSSTVARLVGARRYNVTGNERAAVWNYFLDVPAPAEFYFCRHGEDLLLAAPTDNGRTMLAVQPDLAVAPRFRVPGAVEDAFRTGGLPWGQDRREFAELLADARPDGPARMVRGYQCFFRESAGPGWALVGDAGHVKDVVTGQGLSDAVRQGERLATGILQTWGGSDARLDGELRRWWHRRDRAGAPMYWLSQDMGRGGPVPALYAGFFGKVARSDELKLGLQEVLAQQQPVRRFLSLRRLALIVLGFLAVAGPGRLDRLREVGRTLALEVRRRRASVRPRYDRAPELVDEPAPAGPPRPPVPPGVPPRTRSRDVVSHQEER
jgi:2-polyprenyl-6-methoxyphenol hydroxylase-like FAD-dependent oxidoreductase